MKLIKVQSVAKKHISWANAVAGARNRNNAKKNCFAPIKRGLAKDQSYCPHRCESAYTCVPSSA